MLLRVLGPGAAARVEFGDWFSLSRRFLRAALLGVDVLADADRVFAQAPPPDEAQNQTPPTRAEFLRQQREAKAKALKPHEPNGLERAMDIGEKRIVPLLQRDGVYFKLGSLTTGSGFAYGGGYRDRSFIAGRGTFDVWIAGSLKRYWAVKALAMYPLNKSDTVTLQGDVQRFGFPAEEFFGVGSDSLRADRSNFDLRGTRAGTELVVR